MKNAIYITELKFKIYLDKKNGFSRKPTSYETGKVQNSMQCAVTTAENLVGYIVSGHSFSPALHNKNVLVSQQVFCIDVDSGRTVDENIKICEKYGLLPNIIYPTFSFNISNQKHRLVFILNEPIFDNVQRTLIIEFLSQVFNGDQKTKNLRRIFFGSNNIFFKQYHYFQNKDYLLNLCKEAAHNGSKN